MKTKVQVKDLRKGDQLSSGTRILEGPTTGVTTRSGRTNLYVQYPNKKTNVVEWGKSTTVTVLNR
jgi:hypothetical protein